MTGPGLKFSSQLVAAGNGQLTFYFIADHVRNASTVKWYLKLQIFEEFRNARVRQGQSILLQFILSSSRTGNGSWWFMSTEHIFKYDRIHPVYFSGLLNGAVESAFNVSLHV